MPYNYDFKEYTHNTQISQTVCQKCKIATNSLQHCKNKITSNGNSMQNIFSKLPIELGQIRPWVIKGVMNCEIKFSLSF